MFKQYMNNNESNDKSKIISLGEAEKAPKAQQPSPLTIQQINNIGAAYARLIELRDQKVVTVNTEAELKGLIEFLSKELIDNADELLACWLAVKTEYEPALSLLSRISIRVAGLNHRRAEILAKQEQRSNNEGATK